VAVAKLGVDFFNNHAHYDDYFSLCVA